MNIILLFLIAISLSMDAFSMSLAYGTKITDKKNIYLLSIIVGIYHFIMPIFGMKIGIYLLNLIPVKENLITIIIFLIIGINMIIEAFKSKENIKELKIIEMLLFGFAVSIDSFSIGIGINNISKNILIPSFMFSIVSALFTYVGLLFGNKINKYLGKISTIIGGITLIILGFIL